MKDEHNMTPLNYHFFNSSYWYARYILLYEFQNHLQTPWPVALQRLYLEDRNRRSIFPSFFFFLQKTILVYYSFS